MACAHLYSRVFSMMATIFCAHEYLCECAPVRVRVAMWVHVCVSVSGREHVCGCSVLYASEPVPAGIRKVDLGHKYLISVCCPWKSSIYSWPNGKMPLPDPFPLTRRQKGMGLREAVRGTLTWCGWSRMEATAGGEKKKKKILISCWWEVITRKLQMDSFHKTPLIVCLLWKELLCDTMKSHHAPQNIGYYVFDTVLLSNRINANLKLLA